MQNSSHAQENSASNFLEYGLSYDALRTTRFIGDANDGFEMSDPDEVSIGIESRPARLNISAKVIGGMALNQRTHLIGELGISHKLERITCFCHTCGKIAYENNFDVFAIHTGLGMRRAVIITEKSNINLRVTSFYDLAINRPSISYYGLSFSPMVQRKINENLSINFKLRFSKSFGSFNYEELSTEVSLIKKL